ncbi:hypothetical protein D3C78_1161120 [compost metagenome]
MLAHHPYAVAQQIGLQQHAVLFQPVHAGQLPAFDPGIGIDTFHFADANVVIQRRTDKVILQRRQQQRFAILPPLAQEAIFAGKLPALLAMADLNRPLILVQLWGKAFRCRRRQMQRARYRPLIPGAAMVGFGPVGGLGLHHRHIQPQLAGLMKYRQAVEQVEAGAALRW